MSIDLQLVVGGNKYGPKCNGWSCHNHGGPWHHLPRDVPVGVVIAEVGGAQALDLSVLFSISCWQEEMDANKDPGEIDKASVIPLVLTQPPESPYAVQRAM